MHLWDAFWELSSQRKGGPEPLSFSDIGRWNELSRFGLSTIGLRLILAMDGAYMRQSGDEMAADRERAQSQSAAQPAARKR